MLDVNYVSIKYKIYKSVLDCNEKTVSDIYTYSKYEGEILYICNFVVDSVFRGKRLGAKELYRLIENHEDKLIVIDAKYLSLELNENTSYKMKVERLKCLGKYFKKIGFVDVNKYFGKHKDRIGMCYKNASYENWLKS